MALSKRFLRPRTIISAHLLVPGILLGVSFSFALYSFFSYFREILRILSGLLGGRLLVVLTPQENFYYNLFYGSIAAIIGFYVFTKFAIENSIDHNDKKKKRRQRHILSEHGFFMWSFLLAFTRWTSLLGIWFIIFPMQYDIDFLHDFPMLLILIPLALFLNLWPNIFRTLGNKAYRWLSYAFLSVAALSFVYAHLNFVDYQGINSRLKAQSIEEVYNLRVPLTESHQRLMGRRSWMFDIYMVNDTSDVLPPLLFWNHINTKLSLYEIPAYLEQEMRSGFRSEQARLTANLHIDKEVKLKHVNRLKQMLRKARVGNIQYSSGVKGSRYPAHYLPFTYLGIQQKLYPAFYPEFEAFLDSAEQLDFSRYTLKLPASVMYRNPEINQYNRVEIRVNQKSVTLNKAEVSKEKLASLLYQFIRRYAPGFVIIYEGDEEITYGRYIAYLDLIHTTIDKLRNELSHELYEETYDPPFWKDEPDLIQLKYPKAIIEWTPEEKRLKELMKKTDADA